MRSGKLLAVGLSGVLCLSLAGFTYASAQDTDAAQPSVNETADMATVDFLFCDVDGGQISTDGESWVAEVENSKSHLAPAVEWWTADEYEKWIAEQRKELEALIGTGTGWYDGQGVFHEWTRENVDALINEYQRTLESIKNGTMYSKTTDEGDTCSMVPPTDDVAIAYSDETATDTTQQQ